MNQKETIIEGSSITLTAYKLKELVLPIRFSPNLSIYTIAYPFSHSSYLGAALHSLNNYSSFPDSIKNLISKWLSLIKNRIKRLF